MSSQPPSSNNSSSGSGVAAARQQLGQSGISSKGIAAGVLRSEGTRPSSSRVSGTAGSLNRQPSGGSLAGTAAVAGAGGSAGGAAARSTSSGRASLGAGRTGAAAAATITASRAPAAGARDGGVVLQSNALWHAEHGSMAALQQQAADQAAIKARRASDLAREPPAASVLAPGISAAAAATAAPATTTTTTTTTSSSSSRKAVSQPPQPRFFLPTAGDLFTVPDQQAFPRWHQQRPWLTGSWLMARPEGFVREAGGGGAPGAPHAPALVDLGQVPRDTAEALLVDDLLSVFMGQAGQYIKAVLVDEGGMWPRMGLYVQGVADPGQREQVEQLLPLCEHVLVVKRFVETRSHTHMRLVTQALAAAMQQLQEEWWLLVVQLEHQLMLGQLTLAGLVYYCQVPAASMALLASIAGEAAVLDVKGGVATSAPLLNMLVRRQALLAGDRAGQQLVGKLLQAAAEPYFGILRQWLCLGVLEDPQAEFMIRENAGVERDSLTGAGEPAYWSERFKLADKMGTGDPELPVFLRSSLNAILVTGKYLNVIRLCGQPVPPADDATLAQLRYDAGASEGGSPPHLAGIQAALSAAAGALLRHVMGPQGRLLSWLHCLKHLFLLDQGDLLVHLMEAGDAEASGGALRSLAPHQLQGLLDSALRSSSVAASPHMDVLGEGALSIRWDQRSVMKLVQALDPARAHGAAAAAAPLQLGDAERVSWLHLMPDVKLAWPLNLVVSGRQLLQYQALFKQLLCLKVAERQLGAVWHTLRATKRLGGDDQSAFRAWHLLASQVQHVVCEVLRFTSIDVLEPLWRDMFNAVKAAPNMDEVIRLHNAFLETALRRALLLNTGVVEKLHAITMVAAELRDVAATLQATSRSRGGGSSSAGDAAGGTSRRSSRKHNAAAQPHLLSLSAGCRNEAYMHQIRGMQATVDAAAEALLQQLQEAYMADSQADPVARCTGAAAGVGDSSRELAGLHNLIERLKLGMPGYSERELAQAFMAM